MGAPRVISRMDGTGMFDVHSSVDDTKTYYQELFIGCVLAVAGNLLISVSLNLQKYSHMQSESESIDDRKHYVRRPVWWVGMTLMIFGEIGNFSAYGFAPASVVAPLGSTTVIVNMFIAVIFLKEKLRPEDLFGVFVAVVGAFLLVNFSSKKEFIMNSHQIVAALTQRAFLVYIFVESVALLVLFLLLYRMKMENVLVLLLITSLLASFTVISAKGCSSIIKLSFRDQSQLTHPVVYVMAIVMGVTAVAQVKYLNHAMRLFDATVVVPTNFVFFTISAITAGIVFYKEMWDMTALQVFMFLFGCVLCFVGVFFITVGSSESPNSPSTRKLMADMFPSWLYSTYNRAPVQPQSPADVNTTTLISHEMTSPQDEPLLSDSEGEDLNTNRQYGTRNGSG